MTDMREIKIEKVVLNIGTSLEPDAVKKAELLLKTLSGAEPRKTFGHKRIPAWGVRPGLEMGAKVTMRGEKAKALLIRMLEAVEFTLKKRQFTTNGFSFGVKEYIDIKGAKYDPSVGMTGLDVSVSLARPGSRVKSRRIKPSKVGKKHVVSQAESIEFAQKNLGIKVVEK